MNDKKRILFVDDDELILSCFQRLLGRRFVIDVAAGPAQALQAIETNAPYAAVVTDMRMPGMSGLELLTRAKQTSPETIGVLMSGNTELDELDQALRDRTVFKVVHKPFPADELIAILDEALMQSDAPSRGKKYSSEIV